jgi:hypothetical protein
MPIIAGLVLLIQFSFAFHALKTGRPYWWMFVIMGFPVMGCLIYYFVEVFPGSREHRAAHKTAKRLARTLQPDKELKRRVEEVEICGSVDNKLALARECMNHAMFIEAVKLYESCLDGAFAGDIKVLHGLACAAVEAEMWDKASQVLGRLDALPGSRALEVRLLKARVAAGRGETDSALTQYRELIPVYVGLEARYRYGELLDRLGSHAAAAQAYDDLLRHAKRFAATAEDEQRWVEAARRAVTAAA